jgi:hypothetical protein
MRTLVAATAVMLPLEDGRLPLPLTALRAYDDEGEARDIEAEPESVERVEYGVRIPGSASPLASWFAEPGTQAGRRRMAAEVLHSLLAWERSRLAYVSMAPTGVVHADGRLYCDLLESVVPADREARARQRRGAAACLVFLLSRYPFAWQEVLAGTLAIPSNASERSAWGIATGAIAVLLDPDVGPDRLEVALQERAALLEAAALLDRRFPAWPDGAGEVAL